MGGHKVTIVSFNFYFLQLYHLIKKLRSFQTVDVKLLFDTVAMKIFNSKKRLKKNHVYSCFSHTLKVLNTTSIFKGEAAGAWMDDVNEEFTFWKAIDIRISIQIYRML